MDYILKLNEECDLRTQKEWTWKNIHHIKISSPWGDILILNMWIQEVQSQLQRYTDAWDEMLWFNIETMYRQLNKLR